MKKSIQRILKVWVLLYGAATASCGTMLMQELRDAAIAGTSGFVEDAVGRILNDAFGGGE